MFRGQASDSDAINLASPMDLGRGDEAKFAWLLRRTQPAVQQSRLAFHDFEKRFVVVHWCFVGDQDFDDLS